MVDRPEARHEYRYEGTMAVIPQLHSGTEDAEDVAPSLLSVPGNSELRVERALRRKTFDAGQESSFVRSCFAR